MFDSLKALFSGETAAEDGDAAPRIDQRLAEAALMFHVIAADGRITEAERQRMESALQSEYGLSDEETAELYRAARSAEREAVDLFRFTNILKRKLDREQRIAIIERLWELVFADGELHELEDNVVWRIAKLIEVETPDRIAMKQRVRNRLGAP